MRRFFARNLLFVVGVNLLIKPAWIFLIDRTVQNRVGHGVYGTYLAVLNLSIIFQTVLDFGLNNYNTRIISQDPKRLETLFPALLGTRFLLMGICLALGLTTGLILKYDRWQMMLLCGTMLMQSLIILHLFIRSNVAALQRFRLDGILSVTDRLLMIILCGSLLLLPIGRTSFKIEWFIGLQIICYLIAIFIGLLSLRRITRVPLTISFGNAAIWSIIKQGVPYGLLTFLMAIYMRGDVVIMERIIPDGKIQAGIFAKSFRLVDTFNMVPNIMAGILLPMFGSMLVKKENVAPIIKLSVNLLLPATFLAAALSVVSGTEVLQLLYKNITAADGLILAWLAASLPAYVVMYIYSTLLTAGGELKLLCWLAGIGSIISVLLNVLLITRLGALGTAITAFIVEWTLAICYIVFAAKKNNLPRQPKWIVAHVCYIALLGIACIILMSSPLEWKLRGGIIIALGGTLIFLFRFITPKAIQQFLLRR